jgi:transcriptional regulator with XRE-family HTH domain
MPETDDRIAQRRKSFGSHLRRVRTEAGLSQTAAASRARLDRSFYAEIESGKHSVSVDRLYDIAEALGVAVRDLFADEPSQCGDA